MLRYPSPAEECSADEAVYVCAQLAWALSSHPGLVGQPELKALADTASHALHDLYRATVLGVFGDGRGSFSITTEAAMLR